MKATRVHQFGDPDVLQFEEVDRPVPAAGQVLVRIRAVGINPVEAYMRSGNYGRLPALPFTPGSDAAGTIEALGEGVSGWSAGDRVYTFGAITGTYAEYALCTPEQVWPLPPRASFADGASLGVAAATAWRALFQRGRAVAAETVLIHGATGGVGTAAVQLARAAGLRVAGTGGTPEGRALVERLGAHRVLDHRSDGYMKEAIAFTGGKGFNLIVEFAAHVNLQADLEALAPGGRVVVVGSRGPIQINPRDLMVRDAQVMGMLLFNATHDELRSIHAALYAALEAGTLKPVVDRTMPLSEAAQAHREVMESTAAGKIILVP